MKAIFFLIIFWPVCLCAQTSAASFRTSEHSIIIPPTAMQTLNTVIGRRGYHIDTASVYGHLSEGTFRSVTGHFVIDCGSNNYRTVNLVFSPRLMLTDSLMHVLADRQATPLTIDESIAAVNEDVVLQYGATSLVVALIVGSCNRPPNGDEPFYFGLSLWKGSYGYIRTFRHIDADKYNELK